MLTSLFCYLTGIRYTWVGFEHSIHAHFYFFLRWQYDNKDIISDPSAAIITDKTVYPNGTLHIRSVKEEDIGVYTCMATSSGKTIKSRQAILRQACMTVCMLFSINSKMNFLFYQIKVCKVCFMSKGCMIWILSTRYTIVILIYI